MYYHVFPSYCASSLLSLVYFLSDFGLHCGLCLLPPSLSSKALASQDNAMLRQSDRKCLKSLSGHWGESKRPHRSVTKTGVCFGSVSYSPKLAHTDSHTWSSCHTHTMACSTLRENEVKYPQTHTILYLYVQLPCLSTLPV